MTNNQDTSYKQYPNSNIQYSNKIICLVIVSCTLVISRLADDFVASWHYLCVDNVDKGRRR